MTLTEQAKKFISDFEGCKLKSYQDQGGRWTIGYGATGPGIGVGVEWSQEEADERFEKDISEILVQVKTLVKAPVTQNQLVSLVSFAFNLGAHNLERSGLLRFLNLRMYTPAADQFLLWDRIGSYVSPGLSKRRVAERSLFLQPESK